MINIQLTVTPATPTLLNNAKPENVLDTLLDELQTFTNPNSIEMHKKLSSDNSSRSNSTESKSNLQRNQQQRKSLELRKKNGNRFQSNPIEPNRMRSISIDFESQSY